MTESLGRYKILEQIGQGGFAVVYRAYDGQLDRQVAMKELRPALLANPDAVRNFRQEARNIARLDHPHVVTIYDVYEARQRQFIVMQLVDGASLEERIATHGALPWTEVVQIITALAAGLDYAHSHNILHRDLKPANILLDSNHGPMLGDFGLAKLIGQVGASVTAGGGVVGTPHYIAPEVWEGQGTTPQSDIYALGCILYEMLVGKKVFPGETPPAVMMAHFKALTLPDIWPEGVPSGIADVLATALAPKPADRYATAGEMVQALVALTSLIKSELTPPQPAAAQPVPKPAASSILTTKLYPPPPRPEFVSRPRLIEQLNEGLRLGRKLALISAPAGFGKTTLVSSWLNQNDKRGTTNDEPPAAQTHRSSFTVHHSNIAWLSLDEQDNDLTRFLIYLVAALQTVSPNIGDGVLANLQSSQPPPTQSILTALLNDIVTLPHNFILVLDDYHMIESQSIDKALIFLLEHLPPHMQLVIATREDPPLPLPRLRVRGQLTELRAADLRFIPAEAAEFLNRMMGLSLSPEEIAALESRTEGWIAGLQLAALSMQGQQDAAGFIESFTGSHRYVLDYLVEEVLHQQPESVQAFLLQTSILDRLCGPLCDAVLGGADGSDPISDNRQGQETLEYLERANLFLVPLDNERRWYRYHHLFAELLRQRLHQEPPSLSQSVSPSREETEGERVANLHLRASVWHEQNGSLPEAIRHALAAKDFERTATLLELIWPTMSGSFQSAIWLGWARALPEALVRVRPVLTMAYAWALLDGGDLEAGELRLQDAERGLERSTVPASASQMVVVDQAQFQTLPGSIATARAYLAHAFGDARASVQYARQALEVSPEDDLIRRGQAASLLALAHWADGELEDAHRVLGEAMANFRVAGQIVFAISGTYGLADIRLTQGRLREAIATYEQAMQLAEAQQGAALPGTADLYLGLGDLYREQGDLAAATAHLAQSEALGEPAALPDWPYRFHLAQSRLKVAEGNLPAALDMLNKAESLYFRSPMPEVRPLAALKARLWVALDQLPKAMAWARTQGLSGDDELSYLHEFEYITLARVRIAQYQRSQAGHTIAEALRLLARLLSAAEAGGRQGNSIEILILQALAYQAQGDTATALAPLERALTLAEPEGYVRIFVDEGAPMAKLLTSAASQGMLPDYVNKLLAAFEDATKDEGQRTRENAPPSVTPSGASSLVEPLSERELEVLQRIAAGKKNQEIADELVISLNTVRYHTKNLYGKLDVNKRTQAVARAQDLGLI